MLAVCFGFVQRLALKPVSTIRLINRIYVFVCAAGLAWALLACAIEGISGRWGIRWNHMWAASLAALTVPVGIGLAANAGTWRTGVGKVLMFGIGVPALAVFYFYARPAWASASLWRACGVLISVGTGVWACVRWRVARATWSGILRLQVAPGTRYVADGEGHGTKAVSRRRGRGALAASGGGAGCPGCGSAVRVRCCRRDWSR